MRLRVFCSGDVSKCKPGHEEALNACDALFCCVCPSHVHGSLRDSSLVRRRSHSLETSRSRHTCYLDSKSSYDVNALRYASMRFCTASRLRSLLLPVGYCFFDQILEPASAHQTLAFESRRKTSCDFTVTSQLRYAKVCCARSLVPS